MTFNHWKPPMKNSCTTASQFQIQIHQKQAWQYSLQWQGVVLVAIVGLIDAKVVSKAIGLLYVYRAIQWMWDGIGWEWKNLKYNISDTW